MLLRQYQHRKGFAVAEAQLVTGDANDARASRLNHLDRTSSPNPQLFQSQHRLRRAKQFLDYCLLSCRQKLEWHRLIHAVTTSRKRDLNTEI